MSKKIALLIIDPQISFCDPNGELYVKGAEEDMTRLSKMVNRLSSKISNIHVTLDSHHPFDVAHPVFWNDSNGNNPKPFTIITAKDVETGVWVPSIAKLTNRMLDYVKKLEHNNRYPLCIWPPHTLIGSNGHAVMPVLFDALKKWEEDNLSIVNYVNKGSNPYTEHYSAVVADVIDEEDQGTQVNTKLIYSLSKANIIAVAGEASSHCVASSLRDIIRLFGNVSDAKKIALLTDAMSPVPGFEKIESDFYKEMADFGVIMSKTTDFLI